MNINKEIKGRDKGTREGKQKIKIQNKDNIQNHTMRSSKRRNQVT
jgi:hypothetical protein